MSYRDAPRPSRDLSPARAINPSTGRPSWRHHSASLARSVVFPDPTGPCIPMRSNWSQSPVRRTSREPENVRTIFRSVTSTVSV